MRIFNAKPLKEDDYLRLSESEKKNSKGEIVNTLIRERYSLSEEIAILRQRDTKPEEFAEYNNYAEFCKQKANEIINYGNN